MKQQVTREQVKVCYDAVLERIRTLHVKTFQGHPTPLFLISNAYPGVWLEHVYDAISYAHFDPAMAPLAQSQVELFLNNQKPDGQLPCFVLDGSNPNVKAYGRLIGYGQLQECVSFARLCLEAYELVQDRPFLERAYTGCRNWDNWLVRYRTTLQTGLIELFCEFDSGHDNSPRFSGFSSKGCPGSDARVCNPDSFLPILAPDINAVVFGSRMALARMAGILDRPAEAAQWRQKADLIYQGLLTHCYDQEDQFFYDVDCRGQFRKYRSIHIVNLFQEHALPQPLADVIYNRYLRNPAEFWTAYPFPSLSVADPEFKQESEGNDWGFYAQGLTALRALRWMDHYGKSADLTILMQAWVNALTLAEGRPFTQELHPLTGEPSRSSAWYSSVMLFYLHAVRRLGLIDRS